MNFLLHHAFAVRDHEALGEARAGIVGVGAMLPDLWKMADRRARISASDEDVPSGDVAQLLSKGIDHHRTADAWFHRTTAFTEGERRLRTRFFQTKIPKLLLFAHPAWEMCLDGALLRRRGDALRRPLARALASSAPHLGAVSLARAVSATDLTETFVERVERIAAAGRDGALFDDYMTSEGIAFRLGRMRAAFGLGGIGTDDEARIADALRPAEDETGPALDALFQAPVPLPDVA